ncbi:MAG: DUF3298 and DUF4163 domain-containing protein [Bacteroidales bacterium]|nr:DUF3298 and DUF4163 domain-containing protein [Bacteroidales bacterium]
MTAILSLQSCEWHHRSGASADEELEFCSAVFEDSAEIVDAHVLQSLRADFPVNEDTSRLCENIVAWLCDEVAQRSCPDFSDEWPDRFVDQAAMEAAVREGEASFAENYVTYYGQLGLQHMAEELEHEAGEGFSGGYENNLSIELVENGKAYLTYILHHYIYLGGAHGGTTVMGTTFRKSDGRKLDWSLFDQGKRAEISEKLKLALMTYFTKATGTSVDSDSAFYDLLLLSDDPLTPGNDLEFGLPLPAQAPWLTSSGLVFMYGEYEIAPYSFGHPYCIIPVDEMLPLMTAEGRQWMKDLNLEHTESAGQAPVYGDPL